MSDTDTTETPALPGDGLRESIVDELRRHIGDGLIEHLLKPQDDLWIRVSADTWADTGRALQATGFEYFCFLSGIDWKPSPFGRGEDDPTQPPPERKTEVVQGYAGGETRFQVFARVTDLKRHVGVTIKADVDDENPSIDSWHAIYAGANWHERETHEMYGIVFNGHPDLRNMYLPTEFEGYPLRKDFPLLARIVKPWPGIVDVEPMPAEDADGDGVADAAPAAEGEAPTAAPAEGAPEAAPETAADTSTVTDETVEEAPAHEIPADAAAAEAAEAAPDTVVAEQTAADVAPVAEEAAADVPAEPEGEVEVVTGTADEVEAVADAEADEAREADENAADAAADAAAEASMTESVEVVDAAEGAEEAPEAGGGESSDGSEALSSPKITAEPVAAAGFASLQEPATEESEQPAASPAPGDASETAGPYAGSLVAADDGSMPAGFEIKGNSQSMLFHVPGSRYYNVTKAEYWFDTEENARASGFKKPGEDKSGED